MAGTTNLRHDGGDSDHAYRTVVEFDDDSIEITGAIIAAIAAAADVDPKALDVPLYNVIDPDALDQVVRSGSDDVVVSFSYDGYWVHVGGDGSIVVEPYTAN